MKKIYVPLLLSFFTMLATAQNILKPSQSLNAGANNAATDSWYSKAEAAIELKQNSFRPRANNEFTVINTKNGFGSFITNKGCSIKNIAAKNQQQWEAAFDVLSINGKAFNSDHSKVVIAEKRIVYSNEQANVEYINSEAGLRQNFIINKKESSTSGVSVAIKIKSDLKATMSNDQLQMQDASGKTKLFYDGLKVYDANRQELTAHMELNNNVLTIVADDSKAVYPVTIDPMNHVPDWSESGDGLLFPLLDDATLHMMYGYSVSAAGDINKDGFADVVIGVPAFVDIISVSGGTYNLVSVGAAFIYYGSASGLPTVPSEALHPTTEAGALFGFSVSNAGDVNGDGFADVVIGAPADKISLNIGVVPSANIVSVGKVYVYYGGPAGTFDGNVNTDPTVSVSLTLDQSDFGSLLTTPVNPMFGFSVSTAGDVNGDGKADIVVGSPAYTRLLPTPLLGGRVDIFYGSGSGISAASSHTITGTLLSALFGYSVSTAGNVNNDKNGARDIDDIIVGAPGSLTFLGAGQAFIFNGSTSGITATNAGGASKTLSTGLLTTLFGFSVSEAGDVNGDGYGDVIVGEPGDLENILGQLVSVGSAHIYYGSATGITTVGHTKLNSPRRPSLLGVIQGNLLFGYSVSSVKDVNCDGTADVIVGEPGGSALSLGSGLLNLVSANVVSGKAYIFYGKGGTGPVNAPSWTIQENGAVTVANLLGHSVSGSGDINGDGKNDILVGAPNGTMDLSGGIIPAVGSLIGIISNNSVGSAYAFMGCTDVTLPVTLTSFEATKQSASVVLNWKTEKELNLNYFSVEYSKDGINFSQLAMVFTGSNASNAYSYRHADPSSMNYYRLKMVDMDGKFKYSEIQLVRFSKANQTEMFVYPNPASTLFNLQLSGYAKGDYTIQVINTLGQNVYSKNVKMLGDTYSEKIGADKLLPGLYHAVITSLDGKTRTSTQVIIQ